MESNHPIRGYEPRPCTSIDCALMAACSARREKIFARPSVEASIGLFSWTKKVPYQRRRTRGVDPSGIEPEFLRVGLLRVGAQSVDEGNRTLIARVKNESTGRCTTSTKKTGELSESEMTSAFARSGQSLLLLAEQWARSSLYGRASLLR